MRRKNSRLFAATALLLLAVFLLTPVALGAEERTVLGAEPPAVASVQVGSVANRETPVAPVQVMGVEANGETPVAAVAIQGTPQVEVAVDEVPNGEDPDVVKPYPTVIPPVDGGSPTVAIGGAAAEPGYRLRVISEEDLHDNEGPDFIIDEGVLYRAGIEAEGATPANAPSTAMLVLFTDLEVMEASDDVTPMLTYKGEKFRPVARMMSTGGEVNGVDPDTLEPGAEFMVRIARETIKADLPEAVILPYDPGAELPTIEPHVADGNDTPVIVPVGNIEIEPGIDPYDPTTVVKEEKYEYKDSEPDGVPDNAASDSAFTVDVDGEEIEYDLSDGDSALDYLDGDSDEGYGYAKNKENDPSFEEHMTAALDKVRESIGAYATFWALIPPLVAIVLALITKEVYSSLFIGILCGGLIYAGGNFEGTVVHVFNDGFISTIADSYNIGILIFLVVLGILVAMLNASGGSAAFGRWTTKHIKSRIGAQLCTVLLGVLIFVDDYFNCLTVGAVMRPVTDQHKVSRSKLAYLIDSTAAPICIIAPISSWAAAVAGFAKGTGAASGISLFVSAIPFNFYAILTVVMMIFLAISKFDYGPMKLHEQNAYLNGDLYTSGKENIEDSGEIVNERGRVFDLIIPVVVLIICCVIGMIYSGGFFTEGEDGYRDFITAFSNSDASVGLVYGSFVSLIITIVYFICRRVLSFKKCMESIPKGFCAMVPAILILCCAWTLNSMTGSLGAKVFISNLIESSAGALDAFLPAIIFAIAVGLSFSTGTSWGTFGILIPIVLSVFGASDGPITIIAVSACMAGAVCGDHCSPISDTTIMASAGAQCNHINHVSTQLPYALTVAAVSFVSYIIAGFVRSWYVMLPVSVVLMIITLFVLKAILGKEKAKASDK